MQAPLRDTFVNHRFLRWRIRVKRGGGASSAHQFKAMASRLPALGSDR